MGHTQLSDLCAEKWNDYQTFKPSKIRIISYAISVHCQTTLVAEFKDHYPDLDYDGNRSLIVESE